MSAPREGEDRLRDAVLQYAFGTLEEEPRRELEALLARSAELRAQLDQARELAAELASLVPPERPPAALWERIEARVLGERDAPSVQPWKSWSESDAAPGDVRYRDAARYERTASEGVEVRRLALDAARDRVTIEVRMAPGASYPAHRHGGTEECYVLEGDLEIGPITMRAGDYQRMERGSRHPVQRTRGGCRLLIVSSLRDELL